MDTVQEGWAKAIRFGDKGAFGGVSTWQQGQPQEATHDVGRFAVEGYNSHSLIYACVKEKATSFAELPARVVVPSEDTFDVLEDHMATRLLRNPNDAMDDYEFKATIATHLDVAGNVYIQKARETDNPDRRREFGASPVKALGFLRPDRVKIVPGASRVDDVFEVHLNGVVQERLPRADVIHIKTVNPANDFYGLSPVAVIAKEADLDRFMTDFDLAFFRNAGIPFGMLTTMTRHTPDEKKDIKRSFRKAYTGLKKWFELMVINAEEAKYIPMGGMPKDLEMTATREFGEARVCAVFGVPPVLLGVLVGLSRSTYSNYEQAQFSFWSETMQPLSVSIASAFTRDLLPEFTTSAQRGTIVHYTLEHVKALQEDNTDRLAGVATLLATNGFTVNQALAQFGLAAIEGGDFIPVKAPGAVSVGKAYFSGLAPAQGGTWADTPKAIEAGLDHLHDMAAKDEHIDRRTRLGRLLGPFEKDTEKFLAAQAKRAADRLKEACPPDTKDMVDQIFWVKLTGRQLIPESEKKALLAELQPHMDKGALNGWTVAISDLGITELVDPLAPEVRAMLEQAAAHGERAVVGITDETRGILQGVIEDAKARGLSPGQLKRNILDSTAFNPARASSISRTELAFADNLGAVQRYEDAGVKKVEIIDGPGCGWRTHDDPDTADGSVRSIGQFKDHPLAHPNCVRSRIPIIEGA